MGDWLRSNDETAREHLAVCAMAALAAFARDVDGALETDVICEALYRHLNELLELRASDVYFARSNGTRLERRGPATRGLPRGPEVIDTASEHPVAACARQRRDVAVQQSSKEAAAAGFAAGEHGLFLPMIVQGRLVGVLSLRTLVPFSALDEAIVHAFRDYAAIAIANRERVTLGSLVRQVIDQSDEAVSFYDRNGSLIFSNPAYHRIFRSYPSRESILGMKHEDLYRRDLAEGIIDDPIAKTDPDAYLSERLRLFRELDREIREIQTIRGRTYIYTRTRSRTGATLSRRVDITEMKAAEAQLRESKQRLEGLAFTDPLTTLPNRLGFSELAGRVLAQDGGFAGVLFLGLDHFKDVNDALGHTFGDALLISVGKRLHDRVGPGDLLARVGGDEFAIMRVGPEQSQNAQESVQALADSLMQHMRLPFDINGRRIFVDASIGIAVAPRHGATVDDLLRKADLALDRAKAEGGSTTCSFVPAMDAEAHHHRRIASQLRDALARDEFEVLYQPVIDVRRGVVGIEALLRWRTPDGAEVPPGEFIPIAEDSGLIAAIGEWVLQRVCSDAHHWPPSLRIACNVSARQFTTGNVVDMVARAMTANGIAPDRLDLEITESVPLHDNLRIRGLLRDLRGLGVGVVLDDFGTGYASLSYLRSFPFTKIKIDQVFVRDIVTRPDCFAIVAAVAGLGAELGIATTAEGVETAAQLDRLIQAGCTEVQGHLFAPALPLADALRWLATDGKSVAGGGVPGAA